MPAPAPVANGAPQAELQKLKQKIDHATDESLESTRNIVRLAEETKDLGLQSVVALDEQGEQIERIEAGMDEFRINMQEAKKNLSGMDKCCGLCVLPWQKGSFFKNEDNTWKSKNDKKVVSNQPHKIMDSRHRQRPQGEYIARIINDGREEEMEENLIRFSNVMGNLRDMAIDIGSELDSQKDQLDNITHKSEWNRIKLEDANQCALRVLRHS